MAEMFSEAQNEDSILLLDEADSFFQDRGRANQSWEITHVNEMLTQMESFEGIFIASTNFMESFDCATMRRFDLKVRFDWLKPKHIETLLHDVLTHLRIDTSLADTSKIVQLQCLAPGDFSNVLRQAMLRPFKSVEDIAEALASEAKLKPQAKASSRIGF